jgi:mannosyltransferase
LAEGAKVKNGGVWQAQVGRYALTIQRIQHLARVVHLVPVLIVLLAAFTRFHDLDAQSLWNDEGNSLRLAQRDVGDLINAVGRDIHPPGYYLALKAWIALAGESEFGLRALSALEGVLTVAVTMALGRALFARRVGIWAGVLVALSPFQIYYSQETRMYAQLALLSAASMWVLVRWLTAFSSEDQNHFNAESAEKNEIKARDNPSIPGSRGVWPRTPRIRWQWLFALALINAAGLYTQYSYPFTLLVQGLVFVLWAFDQRPPRTALLRIVSQYAGLNMITLALFVPWLPTAWDQITTWPRTGIEIAVIDQLRTILTWLTVGNTFGEPNDFVLIGPLMLGLEAMLVYRTGRHPSYAWRVMVPFWWGGIVVGALLVSGAYREANLKFLLPAQVAVSLLLAQGAVRLHELLLPEFGAAELERGTDAPAQKSLRRVVDLVMVQGVVSIGMIILVVVMAGQLYGLNRLYADSDYARDDYRAIAAYIEANADSTDAVILDAPNQIEVFSYYYDGDAPIFQLPRGLGGDDAQTRTDVLDVIRDHRRIYAVFWGEDERDPNNVVPETLNTASYPVASRWYGDVRLAQYAALESASAVPVTFDHVRFGEHISLDAYSIVPDAIRRGDVIGVTLFWKTDIPLETRYAVTVQILRPDGTLASQHDAEPGGNQALTTTWPPGEIVIDLHGVVVPPELPPGTYAIIVGLYDINAPHERLPVYVNEEAAGDQIQLTEFTLN